MSRDGSGTYSLAATMAVASATASSTTVNTVMNDVAQALSDSINKDGTKSFVAAQSMGGNKLTSLAAATLLTDAAQYGQVQNGNVSQAATVAGTVDAITLAFTPAITSYVSGQRIRWRSGGANTVTTPTVNVDGLGAKTIKKNPASAALVVGNLGAAGAVHEAVYNGTDFILLNPILGSAADSASTAFAASGAVTGSGLTQATNRLLGRTTASTGAIEEISTGGGLGLASTTLSLNGPAVYAHKNTISQTGVTSNVMTKVTLGTEAFDTNSNFASDRFTPTVAGYYQINGGVYMNGTGVNAGGCALYKNGAVFAWGNYLTNSGQAQSNVASIVFMNGSTDYIELFAAAIVSSGTVTFSGAIAETYFNACLIRGS